MKENDRLSPEYLAWLRTQPCIVLGKRSGGYTTVHASPLRGGRFVRVEAAHVHCGHHADLDNAVPLDWLLHKEQHDHGIKTFQAKYGVDLEQLAREHTERWQQKQTEYAF